MPTCITPLTKPFQALLKNSGKIVAFVLAVGLLLFPIPNQVKAAAGDLDPAFGDGGRVFTEFPDPLGGPSSCFATDVEMQGDGKIITVGGVITENASDFALTRHDSQGLLDSSFGNMGRVTTDFSRSATELGFDRANALAIQPDGKVIAVGTSQVLQGSRALNLVLARYHTDGSLDRNFGKGGKVIGFTVSSIFDSAVALQSDGKIVVTGLTFQNNHEVILVVRYNPNGSLDGTFGSGGKVITDLNGDCGRLYCASIARAVEIQPDNKIIVAGLHVVNDENSDLAILRYERDGSLDTSFGNGGKVIMDLGNDDEDVALDLALQPDRKIIAVGSSGFGVNARRNFALIRFNPDGSLDSSFGTNGQVLTDFSTPFTNRDDVASTVVIQPNGKLVAAGYSILGSGGLPDMAIARYHSDGSLDLSFGSGGKVITFFSLAEGSASYVSALALQSDGKIIAAASAGVPGSFGIFRQRQVLVRYQGDPIPDFDICLQDDSSRDTLKFNSNTGDYLFTQCSGFSIIGRGILTKRGCIIALQDYSLDRRVLVQTDRCLSRGFASIQLYAVGTIITITDRNVTNNACSCN